jgi:hypothetical protein
MVRSAVILSLFASQKPFNSKAMHRFPYVTEYTNDVFGREKTRWDYIVLRPIIVFSYFFVRSVSFPIKFLIHRVPYGFEAFLIDWAMCIGMKYLARSDAAELIVRHVQIEPLLYRHLLLNMDNPTQAIRSSQGNSKLNGIDGDFGIEDLRTAKRNNMTIGHDLLSYELVDRFDKQTFLKSLNAIRAQMPGDHEAWSKSVLEENRRYSWQVLGATNIVLLIVCVITIFGDLRTTINALNSFGSDSVVLWCMKHLYAGDPQAQIDLDFFMQEVSNRGHYNSSAFFSNPSQYLYYHIVFDEVVYDMLRNHPPVHCIVN